MLIPPHIQPILYVVAMGAVCWMLMKRNSGRLERNRRENNRFDTRPTPNTITNAAPSSALALNNAPAEVSRWTIELFDQMRDWQGELQSKSIVLQSLLKMAQEETARLEARLAELRDESYSGTGSPVRRTATPYELAYSTDNRSIHASTTPFFDPQLVERAYRLADEGKSLSEIAARIGKSSADIEFLLSFRSR
ncbi:MAG: hypothetical protein JNK90_04395 [Planctomycetaceae bacterium]|nr:hypothetical protein [Planctomycetaceae bacterium]MBN8602148.1 hypothetical protein [Planctomycetota bacterium]